MRTTTCWSVGLIVMVCPLLMGGSTRSPAPRFLRMATLPSMTAGATTERPDYGLDAPSALWITAGYGVVAVAAGIALKVAGPNGWWTDVAIVSGVVVSSLVIHNIPGDEGRAQAIKEIARVLKPGGHVAIVDIAGTGLYQRELEAAPGMTDVRRSGTNLLFVPTPKRVTATKA